MDKDEEDSTGAIDAGISSELYATESRFATLGEDELQLLLDGRLSKCTKQTVSYALNILSEYSRAKGTSLDQVELMSVNTLQSFLGQFYLEIRKTNGSHYSRSSLITIRYGLQLHFKKHRQINILNDCEFQSANEYFKAALVQLKKLGKGSVQHKKPLTADDFNKLYSSDVLNTTNPTGLQNKVFVDIIVHLCNRGRENLRTMRREDFQICTDSALKRYVCIKDKLTKNHQSENGESSQKGRMYETQDDRCPVSSFEMFIAKLHPECQDFWQKPNPSFNKNSSQQWYCNSPVGKNTLYEKMKSLSSEAKLSNVYTNHCLRATCITALDRSRFEARHIMAVSGQQSEASIRSYSTNLAEQNRREMSEALSSHILSSNGNHHQLSDVNQSLQNQTIHKHSQVTPATAQGITSTDHVSNYQRKLTSNLFDFYKNNKFCDTVIDVQSKQQTSHKFYAHSVILAASNATLYEQLSSAVDSSLYMSSSLKPDIRFYIPIKDCDPVAVEISLCYIYTGQLVVPKSFSDETHMQSVLAACVSLGVPLSMIHGVRLVVEDKGDNSGSSTVDFRCQSKSTVLGPSDENVEPDHQLLDIKIECDPETDDVRNSSSNSFECPASALQGGVVQDCGGILKSAQSGTATSLEHVVNTAFPLGKQAHELASAKQNLSSTINSDAVVASVFRDHLFTSSVVVKKAPKPSAQQNVCKNCGEKFSNFVEHRRHLRDSHALECRNCGFRVMSVANLKRHEATHKTTPRYSCFPCGLTFKMDILYRSHRMKFHCNNTNTFLCHICGAFFTTSKHFIAHSKKHMVPPKCEKCGKHCARKSHFNEHLLSCLTGGKKPFMCDVCGAMFALSSGLSLHLQLHRNGRAVSSECGKSYSHRVSIYT